MTALLLSGCGSGKSTSGRGRTRSLCVVTSLPLSGPDAALGHALESGIRQGLDAAPRIGDGYHVHLCHARDDTPADGRTASRVIAANTLLAVSRPDTIAYIGEVNQSGAAVSSGLLSQQGIPLLSISAGSGYGGYMLGTRSAESAAARALQHPPYNCRYRPARGHKKTACLLVSTPLCTAIGPTLHTIPRVCAAPGPDLTRYSSPAVG
ncbi:MAG: hypothetical protein J2O48_07485, partial [Solirubrobacterales bacterium]|nr:hypothetical protein [Solirubrobacterales bacterium]